MAKYYEIKIIKEGKTLLDITSNEKLQIETTLNFYDIATSNDFNTLSIYNLSDNVNLDNFRDADITIIAGFLNDGILELQGIDISKVNPSLVLKGKVFDLIQDFTRPPDRVFIFRIAPFSIETGKGTGAGGATQNIIFKNGDSLYDFAKSVLKRYADTDLKAIDPSLQSIKNTINDLNFSYNPSKNNIINSLNDFIINWSKTNYKTPLSLLYTPSDIYLSLDFLNTKTSNFQDEIKRILNSIDSQITITDNLILQSPTRPNINQLELQTILLPKVKVGSILRIDKDLRFKDLRKVPYMEDIAGIYFVTSCNVILNFADANPMAWSNLFKLVKIL